jgi:hypothetical protein
MDIALNTLLVALMYVTILTMGIGNLIGSLATIDIRNRHPKRILLRSWELFLLIFSLLLFWLTTALLEVENWGFFGFLYIILGPILLFVLTNLLMKGNPDHETIPKEKSGISSEVFWLFSFIFVWLILSGYLVSGEVAWMDFFTLALAAVSLLLALIPSFSFHRIGHIVAWVLLFGSILAQGLQG